MFRDVQKAIETKFVAEWPAASSNVKHTFRGMPDLDETEWVRIHVLEGQTDRASIGRNYFARTPGVITVEIFTEPNKGEGRSRVLGDLVGAIFRSKVIDGDNLCQVTTQEPSYKSRGDEGTYYAAVVDIIFQADKPQTA